MRSGPLLLVLASTLGACSSSGDDDRAPDAGGGPADASPEAGTGADAAGGDAACGPGVDGGACVLQPDPGLPGCMEVGSGSFSFQPLVTGSEEVELIHGPQGGYHVFGSVRVRDLAFDPGVTVLFHFRPSDDCGDIMLPEAKTPIEIGAAAFRNAGDGWRAAYGFLVILDTTTPEELDRRRFVLGAELTDAAGDVYRDQAEVEVVWSGD